MGCELIANCFKEIPNTYRYYGFFYSVMFINVKHIKDQKSEVWIFLGVLRSLYFTMFANKRNVSRNIRTFSLSLQVEV